LGVGDVTSCKQVELASDQLRVVVLPGRGGDVLSLEHRPTGSSLLWRTPWETPDAPTVPAGADFHDWYLGGWQDLFPNGGAACVVDGVEHEQHGEAWRRAWNVTHVDAALELEVTLDTLPLRARKRIAVDGPSVRLTERIEHVGADPVQMMWGHHPTYGGDLVEAGCRVDLPGGRTECFGAEVDSTSRLATVGEGRWPHLPARDGGLIDLSVVPGPGSRSHDVCLIGDLADGWYAVRNPRRGLGVAVRFPRDVFPFLWMWQPFGGATFAPFDQGIYALALEMWTSPPSLAAAVERGAERRLGPGESVEAEIELTVFAADERAVVGVDAGGAVRLA
jgi:galactose mutarotase-like enzyme